MIALPGRCRKLSLLSPGVPNGKPLPSSKAREGRSTRGRCVSVVQAETSPRWGTRVTGALPAISRFGSLKLQVMLLPALISPLTKSLLGNQPTTLCRPSQLWPRHMVGRRPTQDFVNGLIAVGEVAVPWSSHSRAHGPTGPRSGYWFDHPNGLRGCPVIATAVGFGSGCRP